MNSERLLACVRQARAPHAILIAGPESSGRRELARRAAAIYCLGEDAPGRLSSCPNYFELGGMAVKVDDVRVLLESAAMQGFNGGRRAFVFVNAHHFSAQIQNTLLKTLEEPRADTVLLLTGNEFGLLPTIRSRCVIERLGAKPVEAVAAMLAREGVEEQTAKRSAVLAGGVPGRARELSGADATAFRESALSLFERAAFECAPFTEIAELVTVSEAVSAEEAGRSPRKRKRADPALSVRLLEIWQSVFRDALLARLSAPGMQNIDRRALVDRVAANFTIARIQDMIKQLAMAQQNVAGGANAYLSLDAAAARLFSKESKGEA